MHKSAQIPAKFANLVINEAKIPQPTGSQLLIKVHSAAINPIDYKIQKAGRFFEEFPRVLGEDCAGIVEAVGPDQKKFKKGDRVISFIPTFAHQGAITDFGGFQEYTLSEEAGTCILSEKIGFDEGSTIPLALCTAADGFYSFLGLNKPSLSPKGSSETILIWGGASSVGQFAIQLAKAGGYRVITTASQSGHESLKTLGADIVLDYHDSDIVEQILKITDSKLSVIYDAISTPSTITQVLKCLPQGGKISFTQVTPETANIDCPSNISYERVFAGNLIMKNKDLGFEIFRYVAEALDVGKLKGNPVSLREGGLEILQATLDIYEKEGIQNAKFVINP